MSDIVFFNRSGYILFDIDGTVCLPSTWVVQDMMQILEALGLSSHG